MIIEYKHVKIIFILEKLLIQFITQICLKEKNEIIDVKN